MRLLKTADFKETLPKLLKFEAQSFGDYPYTPAPERLTLWWETGNFFLAGVEDDNGRLESLFTVVMTSESQYELFKEGKLSSSKVMEPHNTNPTEPVALYIPTLIVGNRYWMPVIFKSLCKELDAAMKEKGVSAKYLFATAVDKRSIFLAKRFGFNEVGSYKDGYKVLSANKESSAMFKNLIR